MTSHQIFEHWVRDMIKKHGEPGEGEMEAARDLFDRGRKAGLEEAAKWLEENALNDGHWLAIHVQALQSVSATARCKHDVHGTDCFQCYPDKQSSTESQDG